MALGKDLEQMHRNSSMLLKTSNEYHEIDWPQRIKLTGIKKTAKTDSPFK